VVDEYEYFCEQHLHRPIVRLEERSIDFIELFSGKNSFFILA